MATQMNETEKLLASLKDEKSKIEAKLQPLRDERDALQAQIQPIEDKMRLLAEQMQDIRGERLFEIDKQIGQLSRALGARSMSNS